MAAPENDDLDLSAVGRMIRRQRELAQLSLRQLAKLSNVSNAYLSQIERGLHEPSVRVLRAVSDALSVPLGDLMSEKSGTAISEPHPAPSLTAAIDADPNLTADQKQALLAVYRGFLQQGS